MKEEDYADIFDREDVKAAVAEKPALSIGLLWLAQRGCCYWCGRICIQPSKRLRRQYGQTKIPHDYFTLDHVHSRWQGGQKKGAENVVGSCNRCNQLRNDAEHKREAGRRIQERQPEEIRLKRLCPAVASLNTIPFEKGQSRRERKLLSCAFS